MKNLAKAMAAITSAALLVLGSAAGAFASTSGDKPTPDRIVYVNHPAPRLVGVRVVSVGDGYEASVAKNIDFPLIPEAGETIRIVYTDAVTDVTTEAPTGATLAASCTRSITVNTPYKASGRPRVSGSGMISSGCTSGATFSLHLYDPVYQRADGSVSVPNNGSTYILGIVGPTCWGTTSTQYHALGQFGGSGGTWGPIASLTCSF